MIVWVTRDEPTDGPLSTALRAVGLDVLLAPVLQRRVVDDASAVIGRLGADDWLVLTSAYAVDAVALGAARVPRVAVVGDVSREAARARGFRVELVSPTGTARGLFAELRAAVTAGRVCYPRSSLVPPPEPWKNVEILSPVLYETTPRAFDRGILDAVDVVAVASPSAVQAIGCVDLPCASIGPTTSAALRDIGIEPWIEAREKSFESLAESIAAQGEAERSPAGRR